MKSLLNNVSKLLKGRLSGRLKHCFCSFRTLYGRICREKSLAECWDFQETPGLFYISLMNSLSLTLDNYTDAGTSRANITERCQSFKNKHGTWFSLKQIILYALCMKLPLPQIISLCDKNPREAGSFSMWSDCWICQFCPAVNTENCLFPARLCLLQELQTVDWFITQHFSWASNELCY